MFNKKHNIITVEFIDASNGKALFMTEIGHDQLPQSFEANTTMHIGDDDWHVEKAEPMTSQEFTSTGKLRLTISRVPPVQMMDPNKILLTLPTICDVIPSAIQTPQSGDRWMQMHEDDWRQIEFVSTTFESEIDRMLGSIQNIYDEHRQGMAFKKLYVRSDIANPLDGVSIRLDEIADLGFAFADGIAYQGGGVVQDGFAATSGGLVVFGTAPLQQVTALCVVRISETVDPEIMQSLVNLAQSKSLYLVDWCRVMRLSPNQLPHYFSSDSKEE